MRGLYYRDAGPRVAPGPLGPVAMVMMVVVMMMMVVVVVVMMAPGKGETIGGSSSARETSRAHEHVNRAAFVWRRDHQQLSLRSLQRRHRARAEVDAHAPALDARGDA